MSCTSCNSTVLNPITGCGVDPCSTTKLSTDSIFYTGPTLSCSGIDTCTTVTEALQNLDYKICNPPAFTFTADNGLTKTVNNVQLGGPLIQQTVITTTASNSLVITGLVSDPTPDFLVSQDSSGLLTKTAFSAVLGAITASNGLTKVSNDIKLGGALTGATTITTTGTNTLTVAGLVTDASPAFVITQASTGELVKTLVSSIAPTPATITADNGLTKTSNNIQLGGALITPTTVTTDVTNTLSITGLSTDATPDFYLTETNAGVVKKIGSSTLATNVISAITVTNGLTKTGSTVKLGGTLVENTNVDLDGYTLTLRDAPSGAGILITPASNLTNVYGKLEVSDTSRFFGSVGINVAPSATNEKWLYIGKGANFSLTESTVSATDVYMSMGTTGSETGTTVYATDINRFVWNMNGNQLIRSGTVFAANFSYLQVTSNFATSASTGDRGSLSASAAQCYFTGSGTTERVVAFRAFPPVEDNISGFTGSITEAIGVQVDDQRTFPIESSITRTYGIKQLGVEDINYFNGSFELPSSNVSIGTATLVAGTKTVTTTAVKTGAKIFLSVNTPGGTQGFLSAPAASITNGVSFVINSTSATDTSTVNWWIINS